MHGSGAQRRASGASVDPGTSSDCTIRLLQSNHMTGTDDAGSRHAPPTWNGDAATFQEYEESCLLWEQGTAWEKRYLCGPKLAAVLTGSAKRHVSGKNPSWLSHGRGVLLDHLRMSLGRPQVSDLTDHLSRYFKGSRRRSGESVNDYTSRKSEIYLRARQALQRVSPLQKPTPRPSSSSTPWTPTWSRRTSYDTGDRGDQAEAEAETGSEETQRSEPEQGSWREDQLEFRLVGISVVVAAVPGLRLRHPRASDAELLPDYVQGWYLLHDSGLSGQERNVVQTALQGDFSVARVAQELRNQCAVLDGQRREYGNRGSGYLGDLQEAEFEEPEKADDSFLGDIPENEAQEAMKRTLREARQRQNSVRLSRQYFRTNAGNNSTGGPKPRDDSKIHCLRCGQLGHRVANCPQPPATAQCAKTAEKVEATSSFICYHELLEENRNQRSEEQSRVLAEKRQHAIRTYVGATCIVHHALQKGIHVTLELADRSEAWRLPVLTRLQRKYGLYQAVTKGCRVGLKDKEGIPVQKGWRILTTLKSCRRNWKMPCRCPKGVIHGKCDQGFCC